MSVQFRILGPLDLRDGARTIPLGGDRQRTVLAHLLLHVNHQVTPDQLIETVWPSRPPASAAANLQTYVHRLRKLMPPLPEGEGLLTRGGHYTMALAAERLDATLFEQLTTRARRDGDPATALRLLDEAEALWRGTPLQDLPTPPGWAPELGRLIEARLTATEDRLALRIAEGSGLDTVDGELAELLDRHPYRERLWQQRLLALDKGGRRAEALELYRAVRDRFVADLGIEPGEDLRRTHLAILRGERPSGEQQRGDTAIALHQLPPDVADFTGREPELEELRAAVAPGAQAGAPTVTMLVGAPGTGKSALAVHLAHQVREEFPDGQLYVDLHATGNPRTPLDVLADLLHLLGVVGEALPVGLDARAALFRSRLTGRRVLLVLDDAASAQQLRPLLPAEQRCAVLVTTRARISDVDGARQVDLDVLDEQEALLLLARIAGTQRVQAEPAEAAAIVRYCGYFPLAIRIAGARLAGRRGWSLKTLRTRLADESSRLNELRIGQLAARSSFELSVRQLPSEAVPAFARLALLGAQDVTGWLVDALLGRHRSEDVLDVLVDANLVASTGVDAIGEPRYRMHDLIRVYAAELLEKQPRAERQAAIRRAIEASLALTARAVALLPAAFGAARVTPRGWQPALDPTDAPVCWLTATRRTLLAQVELAAQSGEATLAWQLALCAVPFFDLRGEYDEWQRSHRAALPAVQAAGDVLGEAHLLRGIGQVHLYRDEYPDAEKAWLRAGNAYREAGDAWGIAVATAGQGTLARARRRPRKAMPHYLDALAGLTKAGDGNGQAQVLRSIGMVHRELGDRDAAREWLHKALALAKEVGDAHREAKVLVDLAVMHREDDDVRAALSTVHKARDILESLDDERCTAYALVELGAILLAAGEPRAASGVAQRALAVFRRTGNRRGERAALAMVPQSHNQD
ncbi:AfsR/SARP family transcriptional regulator [Labedaea rhizosphaerae]|uniref:DNA-binding SARP family transcriptional activator n=1 Tax=Labedaea rhizosphaerae TaxID=598644 RepID=A0A4V3CZY5_LABRH|nr:BTAD domain-containing putative transcriptional regulator [Labedaea rhizosphaerae]TDQ01551.1 DNA-binding SARP family transcriptional activator [Labedaea rhizosphaerae]